MTLGRRGGPLPDPVCGRQVFWWDGEYEGECELEPEHDGDHWDGLSWFNDDLELTDSDHDGPPNE